LTYSLSLSGGANTQTTAGDMHTYKGSRYDFVGLGAKFRRIPLETPERVERADPNRFSIARNFKNIWQENKERTSPDYGIKASVGNSFGPFGFQLGAVFSNQFRRRDEINRQFRNAGDLDDPEIILFDDFRTERSVEETRLSGLLTAAYKIGWDHKLSLRALINRNSEDEVAVSLGQTGNLGLGGDIVQQQVSFKYEERELVFGQFAGGHKLPGFRIDWRSALSRTTADQPDSRFQTRNGEAGEPLRFVEDSLGGQRFFNQLEEFLTDSAVDVAVPFETTLPFTDAWSGLEAELKFGGGYFYRDRDFSQRRFRHIVPGGAFDTTLPTEELLDASNVGPGGVDFEELTRKRDQYTASESVLAFYGMAEIPLVRDRLRIVGGARFEDSNIILDVFDDESDELPTRQEKKNKDVLPGVSVIFSPREEMNLRFGFSQTVSRPDFRELSPAEFPAQRGERSKVGNPFLVQSGITSFDVRWEWFFSPTELVSLSYFQKKLDQPIEQTVIQRAADLVDSWANAETADIKGIEFEGRKNLGFIWGPLRDLSFILNATWAESEVIAPRESTLEVQTNERRKLQGQPDLIVNASLEYAHPRWGTARLLYNTIDDRIARVGTFGLPDIIEERRDQVDAMVVIPLDDLLGYPLHFKFSAQNILNGAVRFIQGSEVQQSYTNGVSFGASLGYSR
jgi:outer membrane receptor protein involved in Fe transport